MTESYSDGASRSSDGTSGKQEQSLLWYYLTVVRRRLWVILPIFIIAATIGVIKTLRAPPIYRATAKVLVERQGPQIMDFDRGSEDGGRDESYFLTQTELIRSRAVMTNALTFPGVSELFEVSGETSQPTGLAALTDRIRRSLVSMLGAEPTAAPETWQLLRDEIAATHIEDTHLIHIDVINKDPSRAALLANATARAYQKYHRQSKKDMLNDSHKSLQSERDKQELQLFEAEKELQEFRQTAQAVSVGKAQANQPAMERLTALNEQLTKVQLHRIELTAQISVMRKVYDMKHGISGAPADELFALPIIQSDSTLTASRKALADAENEAAVLADTYGAEHPLLQSAKAKVALLEKQFKTALDEVIRSQLNQLAALESEEKELKEQASEQKQVALALAKEAFTLTRLEGAVERHRKLFDAIVERMREVDISSGLVKTSVQIVERASVPVVPVNAAKVRGIAITLFAALLLGIGGALVVENLDSSVKTPEDLKEAAPFSLFGFIPAMGREVRPKRSRNTADQGRCIVVKAKKAREKRELYRGSVVLSEPVSSVAEAYRNLRTNLTYSSSARSLKAIVLTSCRPQEGKTTTTTNLALTLAKTGKQVLLIDGDMHRPAVHRILGLNEAPGLSNVLLDGTPWQEATVKVRTEDGQPVENLDVLPAGPATESPSEVLGSETMKQLLQDAREKYDRILVDTPPILFVSDACSLSALCDGVILVVKSGTNTRTVIARAKEQLENVDARIVGTILNGVIVSKIGRHHSYYHYHGYARYAKDYERSYYGDRQKEREEPVSTG